jgi:hypothetical protein
MLPISKLYGQRASPAWPPRSLIHLFYLKDHLAPMIFGRLSLWVVTPKSTPPLEVIGAHVRGGQPANVMRSPGRVYPLEHIDNIFICLHSQGALQSRDTVSADKKKVRGSLEWRCRFHLLTPGYIYNLDQALFLPSGRQAARMVPNSKIAAPLQKGNTRLQSYRKPASNGPATRPRLAVALFSPITIP